MSNREKKRIKLADLYPGLTGDGRIETVEDLRRYFGVVKRLYEYILEHDPKTLTELRRRATLTRKAKIALK